MVFNIIYRRLVLALGFVKSWLRLCLLGYSERGKNKLLLTPVIHINPKERSSRKPNPEQIVLAGLGCGSAMLDSYSEAKQSSHSSPSIATAVQHTCRSNHHVLPRGFKLQSTAKFLGKLKPSAQKPALLPNHPYEPGLRVRRDL